MNDFDINKKFVENNVDLDDILDNIKYDFKGYVPKKESIMFIEFRKLIYGGSPENQTPVVHYKVLDNIFSNDSFDDAVMCFRGFAKSTLAEELYWYIAGFNKIPNFGSVNLSLYISDSIDNGVKTMKSSMDISYENSDFLQSLLPKVVTTDIEEKKGYYSTQKEISFVNSEGSKSWLKMYGSQTGVRGTRIGSFRPEFAIFDDLIQKEEDARSLPTIQSIESTVYSDVEDALHPTHRKQIWFGTPFNENDPLYKAITSGAWRRSVYPVCEKFPCNKDDFVGSWEDRFTYESIMKTYKKRIIAGKSSMFYREMMLRIAPLEDKVVNEDDIVWFSRNDLFKHKDEYNYYITTDFATSEKTSSDASAILVWAINSNDDIMLVDGSYGRRLMDKNIDDVFRFVRIYKPLSVGVEVTGQQGGFISWIRKEMISRQIYFNLASDNNGSKEGIRPVKDKFSRFMLVQPRFKMKKFWFPEELKNSVIIKELLRELSRITVGGIKSAHDDLIDCVSMLGSMKLISPSSSTEFKRNSETDIWEEDAVVESRNNPFVV